MNVDGSGTPVLFDYVIPENFVGLLVRVNIHLYNSSIQPDGFGGLAALANGILIQALDADNNLLIDFTDGYPIKKSCEWTGLAGTDAGIDQHGGQTDSQYIRWTIAKAGEKLELDEGQKFRIMIRDDLTGIPQFRAMLQGLLLEKTS